MIVDLHTLTPMERQHYLQASVAPRPICFASTIDAAGRVNLSPFSFFNLFSTTPPVLIFAPNRRVRDNTTKHSWQNVLEVPETVINIVDHAMIQQVSLASCDYPKEVNEFIKAGFTEEPATLVRPPMVKESKVKIECRVLETKVLGEQGGSGNLVICEALRMHVDDSLLTEGKRTIDQRRFELVARLGGDWYCRVSPANLFEVEKPNIRLGIGMDALPDAIRISRILTGNQLGQLANVHEMPVVDPAFEDRRLQEIFQYYSVNPEEMEKELHRYAAGLLDEGRVTDAWQVLLAL
ncbi:MAG TPA: flavin reductase family protein [Puia sp.]|jgi:flavin reductase (DIM6/NTAB) family NADH-FMN oxidoreductase RutF|nr:flavin reductase family protein [Puia sp.]